MNAHPLAVILDDPVAAGQVSVALTLLVQVDPEVLVAAIDRLNRAEALGPLLDPSAWTCGKRFTNSDRHKAVLRKLLELRRTLPEGPG